MRKSVRGTMRRFSIRPTTTKARDHRHNSEPAVTAFPRSSITARRQVKRTRTAELMEIMEVLESPATLVRWQCVLNYDGNT